MGQGSRPAERPGGRDESGGTHTGARGLREAERAVVGRSRAGPPLARWAPRPASEPARRDTRRMRGFLWVTAVVLAVIGIGASLVSGLPASNMSCLMAARTAEKSVAMPTSTRVTHTVLLPGGFELSPLPASYSPRTSALSAWDNLNGEMKEPTASYEMLLGRFEDVGELPGTETGGTPAWVIEATHYAFVPIGQPRPQGHRATPVCFLEEALGAYNAATGVQIVLFFG